MFDNKKPLGAFFEYHVEMWGFGVNSPPITSLLGVVPPQTRLITDEVKQSATYALSFESPHDCINTVVPLLLIKMHLVGAIFYTRGSGNWSRCIGCRVRSSRSAGRGSPLKRRSQAVVSIGLCRFKSHWIASVQSNTLSLKTKATRDGWFVLVEVWGFEPQSRYRYAYRVYEC